MHVVILCGGSGSRLWPASTPSRPKQYLRLFGEDSLLVATARRALAAAPAALSVLTQASQQALAEGELRGAGIEAAYLIEPAARNTGPAIVWAAETLLRRGEDGPVAFLPADHHVPDAAAFARVLRRMAGAAAQGGLIVAGRPPAYAETGYGYIQHGASTAPDVFAVRRFVEKPDLATARRYLLAGDYWWNTGLVVARPREIVAAARRAAPALVQALVSPERYAEAPALSFDHAVLERAANVRVVAADFAWSDVGSWSSWADLAAGPDGNAVQPGGRLTAVDARNNAVWSGKPVVLHGVDDLIVVETETCLLVTRREYAQQVGSLAKRAA